ncbi:hypothetical protein G6F46_002027 [Rhizopus delemar]|uniref:Uncharacterized protein n=2 Tax=Rhizopus TaxID=4842 RepID=A0A9P7CS65_9FUNG|nr:hypothetical protein G6F55_000561 [Rhizopus delemar]KAG1552342.1 hypothetical protein G6F51_001285 [Rhizopus arrhizus]KAG1502624.1 hypothetical protein G6F54_002233 [Rhizopus delemar]KAG1518742.1 hypothetical protein G6F53_000351 [Rhizopus delemar]KAG1525512.1 hypothetical protein G6F52_003260 [Rhizopus delemar]
MGVEGIIATRSRTADRDGGMETKKPSIMNNIGGGGPIRRKDPRLVAQANANKPLINNNIKSANTAYASVPKDPFGPFSYEEKRQMNPQQDYNMRQIMKSTLSYANSVSFGFFVSKPSNQNNIIPCIPRY